jgi:catechol 2,3-dioxygenase-like lactoylglutathione lyase family enzyme
VVQWKVSFKVAIQFNHLLIFAHSKDQSAHFLTRLFGLPDPKPAGFFLAVDMANDVTLHYGEPGVEFLSQHYAFLVSDDEFDAIFVRMQEDGMDYWADPRQQRPGEINTNHGGRGVYFLDPSGHGLEIITRPYGSGQA